MTEDVTAPPRVMADSPAAMDERDHPLMGFDRRVAQAAWSVALVAGLLYAVYAVRQTLFIFILGLFFAYLIYPLASRVAALKRPRLSRAVSAGIVFGLLIVLLAIVGVLVGPTLTDQASHLSQQLPSLLQGQNVLERIPLPHWLLPYREQAAKFVSDNLQSGASFAMPMAKKIGVTALVVAGNLIYVIVVPILAFLLLKDGSSFRDAFIAFADRGRHGEMWRHIVTDLDGLLGSYMRALLILSLATLLVYSTAFSIAGVPYGLILASTAAVLEFVPVLGPFAAAAATLIVALLTGYEHVFVLLGIIAAYRLFQDYVLSPYLMSGGVSISPILVLFGLLGGDEIAGVAGIFLSVPVLAGAKIIAVRIGAEVRKQRAISDSASRRCEP